MSNSQITVSKVHRLAARGYIVAWHATIRCPMVSVVPVVGHDNVQSELLNEIRILLSDLGHGSILVTPANARRIIKAEPSSVSIPWMLRIASGEETSNGISEHYLETIERCRKRIEVVESNVNLAPVLLLREERLRLFPNWGKHPLIDQLLRYTYLHSGDKLDSNVVSRAVSVPTSTLKYTLSKEGYHGISHLVSLVRLKQAQYLMEEGWGTLTQIAYEVGFGCYSAFEQSFVRSTGMYPRSWLKQRLDSLKR